MAATSWSADGALANDQRRRADDVAGRTAVTGRGEQLGRSPSDLVGRPDLMAHYQSNHVAVAYGDVFAEMVELSQRLGFRVRVLRGSETRAP